MASKKLQKRIAAAERMEARAKQLALQADLARKAIGAAHRAERTSELCDIGGDALSVGLGRLSPAERYGAFMFIADMMESEVFLAECRRRSAAEMARRQKAREANNEQKRRKRKKRREPDVEIEVESVESVRTGSATLPPMTAHPDERERLIVRFSAPIPKGHRLKDFDLKYDSKRVEWRGKACRAAVQAEIAGSAYGHLLVSIEPAVASDPVASCPAPATQLDSTVTTQNGPTRKLENFEVWIEN